MSRTAERQGLTPDVRLFMLEGDIDRMEEVLESIEKKTDALLKLMVAVLVALLGSAISIAATISLSGH